MVYCLGIVTCIALILGWIKSNGFEISVEVNEFSGPGFKIGVTSERYYTEDEIQDEVVIGLFFVNFIFTFYKPLEDFGA